MGKGIGYAIGGVWISAMAIWELVDHVKTKKKLKEVEEYKKTLEES